MVRVIMFPSSDSVLFLVSPSDDVVAGAVVDVVVEVVLVVKAVLSER